MGSALLAGLVGALPAGVPAAVNDSTDTLRCWHQNSRAALKSCAPNISGSGRKRMKVPRRFCTLPALTSFVTGLPRS